MRIWIGLIFLSVLCVDVICDELKDFVLRQPNDDAFSEIYTDEWAYGTEVGLHERILQLIQPQRESVSVHIYLVGFEDTDINAEMMSKYFKRLEHRVPVHVVKSQELSGVQKEDEFSLEDDFTHSNQVRKQIIEEETLLSGTGPVLVERAVTYKVSQSPSLAKKFRTTLLQHTLRKENRIPFSVVDTLVEEDFQSSSRGKQTSIYIFNVELNGYPNASYMYFPDGGSYATSCGGVSQLGKKRWMWLDIRAGPTAWGPRSYGEGSVTSALVPYIHNYQMTGATKDGETKQLATDLVGWIRRSVELLLCPAVDHFPYLLSLTRPPAPTVIKLIIFHDHEVGEIEKYGLFSTRLLESAIQEFKLFPEQKITFEQEDVSILNNTLAAMAYQNSLRTYIYDTMDNLSGTLHTHHYLDSKSLHYWLQRVKGGFISYSQETNTIPIFLFDFSFTDMLLIDREAQVVSFPDMVIAVQTEDSMIRLPYHCDNLPLTVDGRDVSRQIVGGMIQTLWGTLASDKRWNSAHKKLENDWMWSTGRTPYGPFSPYTDLTFVETDGIHRPQLYQLINQTITHTLAPLLQLSKYRFELHNLLDNDEFLEFCIRWNFLNAKLGYCMDAISLHDWNQAYLFVRSAFLDSELLEELIEKATGSIKSYLECKNTTSTSVWVKIFNLVVPFISVILGGIMILYLIVTKAKSVFGSKKKQKEW